MTPANKDAGVKLLAERFKLSPEVASRTGDLLTDPKFGLATDAAPGIDCYVSVMRVLRE